MDSVGRLLIIAGAILLFVGVVLVASNYLGWLGRLPGDFVIKRKNLTIYLPVSTSLLISVLISAVLYIVTRK